MEAIVIWPLRIVLCLKTGDLLFHCTRVQELSVVGKIYAEILVDRIRRVTGGLIDDEQGGL